MSNKIKINVFQEMDDQQKLYQNSSNPIDNYIKSENLDSLKRGPSNSETININPENEIKPKINLEIPKDDSLLISTLENKNNSSSLLLFGLGLLGLLIISSSLNEKKSKSDSQDKKE